MQEAGGRGDPPHKLVRSICCLSVSSQLPGNICSVSHFSTTCLLSPSLPPPFLSSLSHSLSHLYLSSLPIHWQCQPSSAQDP